VVSSESTTSAGALGSVAGPDDTTGSLDKRVIAAAANDVIATLVVLSGSLPLGKMFRITLGEMVIGRSSEAMIWVDDEGVSRRHAKLVASEDTVTLIDLASRNGTYCNGAAVTEQVLQNGDKIQIGRETVFRYSLHDSLDEAMQRHLYESATHDGLTGIHNRRFFTEMLDKEFAHCARHAQPLSLLMIDLDHFKEINDAHGHLAGDHALVELAHKLSEIIRTEDVLARYGGEEFMLLLRECPHERAQMIAERLRRMVERLDLLFNHQGFKVTVSVGVATLEEGNHASGAALLEAADKMLYAAKQAGRNRVAG
jgi:diguanylate cyclase (GGDEF)-like protein